MFKKPEYFNVIFNYIQSNYTDVKNTNGNTIDNNDFNEKIEAFAYNLSKDEAFTPNTEDFIEYLTYINKLEKQKLEPTSHILKKAETNNVLQLTENDEDNIASFKNDFPKEKYVSDIISSEIINKWSPEDNVFISAGTGRGKNFFIKNKLISNGKTLIFENRNSLMSQQKKEFIENIFSNNGFNLSFENPYFVNNNNSVMLISYQYASKLIQQIQSGINTMDTATFSDFLQSARYFVFDEIHYLIDDAQFNKEISFFTNFIFNSKFSSTKIFMSGSMEEVYLYLKKYFYPNLNKTEDKRIFSKLYNLTDKNINSIPHIKFTGQFQNLIHQNYILNMPTDYKYITPLAYRSVTDDVYNKILSTKEDEKWLIFVSSKKEGKKLLNSLNKNDDIAVFINADNKESSKINRAEYNDIINGDKFNCRVLITTTLLYNGINIKDPSLKHIVVPETTVSIMKQLIGRKRINYDDTIIDNSVNVYFPISSRNYFYNNLKGNLRKFIEILNVGDNNTYYLQEYYNSTNFKYADDCFYADFKQYNLSGNMLTRDENNNQKIAVDQNNQPIIVEVQPLLYYNNLPPIPQKFLTLSISYPAVSKLYFDTMFYIFVLHKFNKNKDNELTFIKCQLEQLGIGKKFKGIVDISKETELLKNSIKEKISTLLEQYIDKPLDISDLSAEEVCNFREIINSCHKEINDGENISPHYKSSTRFIPFNTINRFIEQLELPYKVSKNSEIKCLNVIRKVEKE